jgi:stage II sporulation protein D
VTYFFSSSGGYTEDVQNVWQGVTPEAWLQGEPDPYDGAGSNPYHRWLVHLSLRSAAADLRGLVRGTLVGITVTRHGVSPRVVTASVVGTKGRTTVTGTQLQEAFGLMSTYMSFTTIRVQSTSGKTSRKSGGKTGGKTGGKSGGTGSSGGSGPFSPTVQAPGQSSSGGASFQGGSQRKVSGGSQTPLHGREVHGTVFPARRGTRIAVQQLETSGYVTVARGRTHSGGWYAIRVPMPGTFRVVVGGVAGPSVAVR